MSDAQMIEPRPTVSWKDWVLGGVGAVIVLGIAGMISSDREVIDKLARLETQVAALTTEVARLTNEEGERYTMTDARRDQAKVEARLTHDELLIEGLRFQAGTRGAVGARP